MIAVVRIDRDFARAAVGINDDFPGAGGAADFLREAAFPGHLRVRQHRRARIEQGDDQCDNQKAQAAKNVHAKNST